MFFIILILAIFLRFYQFPFLPAGLQSDEAGAAYETYSLLLRGTDRWGNKFPVYFPSWGSGQNVLLSYLNMPFIKIFGLTDFGARFSSALLSILTIIILYAFVKKWFGRRTALIASFLLSITPWHIMMSRWSLESNFLPGFLLLGVTFLSYCYTSKHSRKLIPFSLIFLALAFYAYGVAIVIIPFFLLIYFSLVGLGKTGWERFGIFLSFIIFLLIALPFFLFVLENYVLHKAIPALQQLPFSIPLLPGNRLAQISAGRSIWITDAQFFVKQFNVSGIMDKTDYAPLGLLGLPFVAIGIYYSIRKGQVHANIFLIWLIATLPIFFLYPVSMVRANALFIPLIALGAIGINGLFDSISDKNTKRALLSLILVTISLYNAVFCCYYFFSYNDQIKNGPPNTFNAGLDSALRHAQSFASAKEPIYLSNKISTFQRISFNYEYILFFLKVDPIDFQKYSKVIIYNKSYKVLYYKNFYFYPDQAGLRLTKSFIGILRGHEKIACGNKKVLYAKENWTVVRCRK